MGAQDQDDAVSGVSRRDLLKKGAVVGVTAAWTIPLVQVVSMTPAHADSPSAPPAPPTNNPPLPTGATIPVTPSGATGPATVTGGGLASTGSNPLPAVGLGAAAVAIGLGAIAASQVGRKDPEQPSAE
jgi:hypothetical protein